METYELVPRKVQAVKLTNKAKLDGPPGGNMYRYQEGELDATFVSRVGLPTIGDYIVKTGMSWELVRSLEFNQKYRKVDG